jgi:hypothetical protein
MLADERLRTRLNRVKSAVLELYRRGFGLERFGIILELKAEHLLETGPGGALGRNTRR